MKIYSVTDPEFKPYGQILEGYDTEELCAAMAAIPQPEGVSYEPGIESLEACAIFSDLRDRAYGGMPIQVNIGWKDFILLLAKQDEIIDGVLDTAKVKAFRVPAGLPVEVYATTLHYAPCHTCPNCGFRVAVVLPKGTNTAKPDYTPASEEDKWMTARNKWLLAHPESAEAKNGAHVGLTGVNIDIKEDL